MSRFKEQKRSAIEAGKEKGDVGLAAGEQRVNELQSVKGMIDSIYANVRDDESHEQVRAMEQQYREAGREAYRTEVADVVRDAHGDLERNKSDIADERSRTESAASSISDMQGVTNLARNEAKSAESNLKRSAGEFKDMETITDNIESQQESQSQNIRSRIEGIFG